MSMKLSNLLLAAAIACGVVFLSGLGVWQVKRLAWKEAMVARVENNLKAEALDLAEIEQLHTEGEDIEYRPVRLSGVFDHSREQHFFATHKGAAGYYVYAPLQLESGRHIFVNRGFVPLERKSADSRMDGQIGGTVTLTGLARTAPLDKPNSFVPDNDLEKNVYHWKSLEQMKARAFAHGAVDVLPFFVDVDAKSAGTDLPVGGVTLIRFPNNHLQYAITWFGLAATLLVVGGLFLFGRTKRRKLAL